MKHLNILRLPDCVSVRSESNWSTLKQENNRYCNDTIEVVMQQAEKSATVVLKETEKTVEYILLKWKEEAEAGVQLLGDHWERSYGDLYWHGILPEKEMPWYFYMTDGKKANGYGVMTGPSALCSWFYDGEYVSLLLDVRCGGSGLILKGRDLEAASIISYEGRGESIYEDMHEFCKKMCEKPLLPKEQIYGGNNWYYAYGKFDQEDIITDSKLIKELSEENSITPYMVLDDGWQSAKGEENISTEEAWLPRKDKFPDFEQMIAQMKEIGVKPGIWYRPLLTTRAVPEEYYIKNPHTFGDKVPGPILDPSDPEVLKMVTAKMKEFRELGFELVKHDFTTFDCMGRWGAKFNFSITDEGWSFKDRTKTTAEIYKNLYAALREGAKDMPIIGCNTFSHLSAGYFEIQRTGDDTSGKQWERTRKMGVNTLAFRMAQHNAFYAVDADCVGITEFVDWEYNKQWLDVLGKSGTPLFVSADPKTITEEQKEAVKLNFTRAAKERAVSKPLDFLHTSTPRKWESEDGIDTYEWADPTRIELCSGYLG